MDLATIIGICSGFLLLGLSIFTQDGWHFFLNLNALLIVLGGTLSATLINFPLSDVLKVINVAKNAMMHQTQALQEVIEFWLDLARKARQEGILALEEVVSIMDDEFGKKAIQLMVDKVDTHIINDILRTELVYIEARHELGQKVFKTMGAYSPAFGMVGTLIGLIQMLQKLNDPSQIGAGMAVALVTTLYGSIFANLIFLPLAGKLETRTQEEILNKELIIQAISSIQDGDNPRLLNEKLRTLVAPSKRVDEVNYESQENVAA